jgi:hypothetical protein
MLKKLKDYNCYFVDENGNVYSNYKGDLVIKSSFFSHNGYKRVKLWQKGKSKNFFVHRLFAEYFVDNPNNYDSVDHIDRNILNNNYKNLRWMTHSANSGLSHAKLTKEEVEYIKSNYRRGNGQKLSKMFNCDLSVVVKIAKGKAYNWINEEVMSNAN